jgi:hypothetical protein
MWLQQVTERRIWIHDAVALKILCSVVQDDILSVVKIQDSKVPSKSMGRQEMSDLDSRAVAARRVSMRTNLSNEGRSLRRMQSTSRAAGDRTHGFHLLTERGGYNCGRMYCFRVASNEAECDRWIGDICAAVRRKTKPSLLRRCQVSVEEGVRADPARKTNGG